MVTGEDYYLLASGRLQRKDNSLVFEPSSEDGTRKNIPVETVGCIYAYGSLDVNSKALELLAKYHIQIHYFDYYGNYVGSFNPREYLLAGAVLVEQVRNYADMEKRMTLAREFIIGAISNLRKNVDGTTMLQIPPSQIRKAKKIEDLMGIEGSVRKHYYQLLDDRLPEEFKIRTRQKQPPGNRGNALISFGNSLCYAAVLRQIYHTQLNPTISFLHEPGYRRFSLSLDISEIFKPFLVDRLVLRLVNLKQIQEKHFVDNFNGTFLNDRGRRIFTAEWDEQLKTTVYHRQLKRDVSYRKLIRLECLKLVKCIFEGEKYTSFKMWW